MIDAIDAVAGSVQNNLEMTTTCMRRGVSNEPSDVAYFKLELYYEFLMTDEIARANEMSHPVILPESVTIVTACGAYIENKFGLVF